MTRRSVLGLTGLLGLGACVGQRHDRDQSTAAPVGASHDSISLLHIQEGETHTLVSSTSQSHTGLKMEDGARLRWEDGATLELVDQ